MVGSAAASRDQYGRKPKTSVSSGSGVGEGATVGSAGTAVGVTAPDGLTDATGAALAAGSVSPPVSARCVTVTHETEPNATATRTAAREATRRPRAGRVSRT